MFGPLFRKRLTGGDPSGHVSHMLVEIAGRRIAATSRSPRPRNETIDVRIVNQMLDNPVAIAAAVARRILQLRANLGARFSEPLHFHGRKLPWQSDMRRCVRDRKSTRLNSITKAQLVC